MSALMLVALGLCYVGCGLPAGLWFARYCARNYYADTDLQRGVAWIAGIAIWPPIAVVSITGWALRSLGRAVR